MNYMTMLTYAMNFLNLAHGQAVACRPSILAACEGG